MSKISALLSMFFVLMTGTPHCEIVAETPSKSYLIVGKKQPMKTKNGHPVKTKNGNIVVFKKR